MTEPAPRFGVPQFGAPQFGAPGAPAPRDRPAAFGVVEREGSVAVVRITRGGEAYIDLPGGALDPGEDDAAAMVREFGEETGLVVAPLRLLGRADQYFLTKEGEAVNNRAALFEARATAEDPALKIEDDHELRWLDPLEALAALRHPAHAWAVALWLRARREDVEGPLVRPTP